MSISSMELNSKLETLHAEQAQLAAVVAPASGATPLDIWRARSRLVALDGERLETAALLDEQRRLDKLANDAEKDAIRLETVKRLRPYAAQLQDHADGLAAVFAKVKPILAEAEARGVVLVGVLWPDMDLGNPDSTVGHRLRSMHELGLLP